MKLNNLIRRFMVMAYVLAILSGIFTGLLFPYYWPVLCIPLFMALFLLAAYFLNIWVEHRYIVFPYERNSQITLISNKELREENLLLKEMIKKLKK